MINSILENNGFRPRFTGREGSIFTDEDDDESIVIILYTKPKPSKHNSIFI